MNKINGFFKENNSDIEEILLEELREQKKYELPVDRSCAHSFKCAMAGLGFFLGSLTLSGFLSSYIFENEQDECEIKVDDSKRIDEKKDLSRVNSSFKSDIFYLKNAKLESFYFDKSNKLLQRNDYVF